MPLLALPKHFYTHAWETYLIGGFVIFLIGFLLGWLLWRHCRVHAERVESLNENLRERYTVLTDNNRQLSDLLDGMTNKPTASSSEPSKK